MQASWYITQISKPGLTSKRVNKILKTGILLGLSRVRTQMSKRANLFYTIATEAQCLTSFLPPWAVSDLVARGGLLGKDK